MPRSAVVLLLSISATGLSAADDLTRGEYLVTQVARCVECHSPTTEAGQPDPERHLHGAVLPYRPRGTVTDWSPVAPRIAGLVGWTDPQAIRLLTTGIGKQDAPLKRPMPRYRLDEADARAVVVYLRSLAGK